MKTLEFEKPILELEKKIEELKSFSDEKNIDLSDEIITLQKKAEKLYKEIYGNLTPWQRTQVARQMGRPNTLSYIDMIFEDFIGLHGDRLFGDDKAIVGGIAKLEGRPVTIVGHLKGQDHREHIKRNFGMPQPEGYRKALRLMEQANKFKRPIITFIDTPGAYPGIGAEERGQSIAIAENLQKMAQFSVPIIVVVIGEGGSGGALALGVGDRIFMLENTVYSVISPEGAASILWREASKAQEAAAALKITSKHLQELGVIDGIIPEPLGGAHKDPQLIAKNIKSELTKNLHELLQLSSNDLIEQRYNKFRSIGSYLEDNAK